VLDVRRRRELGPETWSALSATTSSIPFAAILTGRAAMPWRDVVGWRLAAAAPVYVTLISLHEPILWVSPFPP
jgi:uncharacterized membrane protein